MFLHHAQPCSYAFLTVRVLVVFTVVCVCVSETWNGYMKLLTVSCKHCCAVECYLSMNTYIRKSEFILSVRASKYMRIKHMVVLTLRKLRKHSKIKVHWVPYGSGVRNA